MTHLTKGAVALALAGALTASAVSTASARSWRPWAAAGAGFAAGAIVGSALTAPRYGYAYGPAYSGYAYEPGYAAYEPGYAYAYAPAYDSGYGAYAYAPGVAYESTVVVPRGYGYDAGYRGCATRGNYGGKTDYGAC